MSLVITDRIIRSHHGVDIGLFLSLPCKHLHFLRLRECLVDVILTHSGLLQIAEPVTVTTCQLHDRIYHALVNVIGERLIAEA